MKMYDKTISNLYDLTDHEDKSVAEASKAGVVAIQELIEERAKLLNEIDKLKEKGVQ